MVHSIHNIHMFAKETMHQSKVPDDDYNSYHWMITTSSRFHPAGVIINFYVVQWSQSQVSLQYTYMVLT